MEVLAILGVAVLGGVLLTVLGVLLGKPDEEPKPRLYDPGPPGLCEKCDGCGGTGDVHCRRCG